MKRLSTYLPPIIFIMILVGINWFLFIYLDLLAEPEKRITAIISTLAIGFGIFQFWVSEINNKQRRLSEMRYNEYRQIFFHIESIADMLNNEMTQNKPIDVHRFVSAIMNQSNRIAALINVNRNFLFPKLTDTEESDKLEKVLSKMVVRSDQFRKEIDKAIDLNGKTNELV